MDYTNFLTYPIQILGINDSYDDELNAIEELVINDIKYSGDVSEIATVLPFFVFFRFCENKESTTTSETGEMRQVAEFSEPSLYAQIRAWNLGAEKLNEICLEKGKIANPNYLSKINALW